MPFGFAGKELEIHLTKSIIKKNYSNIEHYTKFLGGRGIATKRFIERVSPDTDPFSPLNPLILSKTGSIKQYWNNWPEENGPWLFNGAMHGNYEEEVRFEDAGKTLTNFETTYKTRAASCFNCGVGCKSIISLPNGQYASIKCQSYFNFMFATKICDIHFSVQCFKLCENYGLDVISTAYLTGFAIDLCQKGLL